MIYEDEEPQWNGTDSGKPKNSKKNLSQYRFYHRKSHKERPGRELGPPPVHAYS
jgi:hypothetical protein